MYAVEFRMFHKDLGEWDEWKFSREYKTEKAMLAGLERLNAQAAGVFEYRRMKEEP